MKISFTKLYPSSHFAIRQPNGLILLLGGKSSDRLIASDEGDMVHLSVSVGSFKELGTYLNRRAIRRVLVLDVDDDHDFYDKVDLCLNTLEAAHVEEVVYYVK